MWRSGGGCMTSTGLADAQVARAMFALRRQVAGNDFLPLEQQRIVAISCVLRSRDGLKVWSLGDLETAEGELVQRFFDGIEKYSPDLVSWNGSGFDLPVLNYRALLHRVSAPRFWETGAEDATFRYNNYLSRYHWRHTDLMDVLSGYQGRGRVSLSNMAILLGLPGKLGFDGSQVWDAFQGGDLAGIRAYCETDVLNTWLVWLRFALLARGTLRRAARRGARAREELAGRSAAAALHAVPARLGGVRLRGAGSGAPQPEEVAVVAALTHEGEGVVHAGKTVFVAGALPGERIRFTRSRRHRQHDDGVLLEVLEPAPVRRVPRCVHFGVCGGCALQHLDPAAQLAAKEAELKEALTRVGQVAPARWLEPLAGPHWGYRRRARLGAKFVRKKGHVVVGFRERAAPYVAELDRLRGLERPGRGAHRPARAADRCTHHPRSTAAGGGVRRRQRHGTGAAGARARLRRRIWRCCAPLPQSTPCSSTCSPGVSRAWRRWMSPRRHCTTAWPTSISRSSSHRRTSSRSTAR